MPMLMLMPMLFLMLPNIHKSFYNHKWRHP